MSNKEETDKLYKYQKLLESFFRIVNHFAVIEKRPKKYGTDELFHKLEIHTIHAIGENPGINITELAKWHGITKSAVSQVVKKLEKRGHIFRYKAPDNDKEVLFKLTEKGRKPYEGHKKLHAKIDESLIEEIAALPEEKYQFLLDFFDLLADHLESHMHKD
jgi:DNA-binding MarR family transcriptional regulator